MQSKPILIHTHFHKRRTGVTSSIENILHLFENKFETYVFGYGIKGNHISFIQILNLVFKKKYFALHCHRNNEIIFALLLRLFGGNFKLLSTRHSETKPSWITKYLLQKSDTIITLNKNMQRYFDENTNIVFHGINPDYFKPLPNVTLNNIQQKNIISCVGRVRKAKGQKVLVEAIAPILYKFPDWALVIVGKIDNAEFFKELLEITTTNNVNNQIYFLEETPAILKVYQASHTVVVPSFSEGCSLVTVEAMSCGCNVIATKNVGTHSELFNHGQNGYLFEAGNSDELRSLLYKTMNSEQEYLGIQARETVINAWSINHETELLTKLYLA